MNRININTVFIWLGLVTLALACEPGKPAAPRVTAARAPGHRVAAEAPRHPPAARAPGHRGSAQAPGHPASVRVKQLAPKPKPIERN